jgi:hypothetical protein
MATNASGIHPIREELLIKNDNVMLRVMRAMFLSKISVLFLKVSLL